MNESPHEWILKRRHEDLSLTVRTSWSLYIQFYTVFNRHNKWRNGTCLPWPLCGFTWVSFASRAALPFGRLWYGEPNAITNAIGYARFFSRSHHAVIRVYDEAENVIETQQPTRDFKEP